MPGVLKLIRTLSRDIPAMRQVSSRLELLLNDLKKSFPNANPKPFAEGITQTKSAQTIKPNLSKTNTPINSSVKSNKTSTTYKPTLDPKVKEIAEKASQRKITESPNNAPLLRGVGSQGQKTSSSINGIGSSNSMLQKDGWDSAREELEALIRFEKGARNVNY